jgi:cystathionine beta-lyase/cystathionine gamma-synthase
MSGSPSSSEWSVATLCVHGGYRPGPGSPDVVAPISRTSTFLQDETTYAQIAAGRASEALIYTRYGNPTLDSVETVLAALEGTERALVFASGMAALHAAVLATARPGSTIVVSKELYGGTRDLLLGGLVHLGFAIREFGIDDFESLERALEEDVSLVLCESVSNPTLAVADLPRIAAIVHAGGAKLLVDATFVSPILERPTEHGADLVMHSATKYLGGHSDLTAGVICGGRADLDGIWTWRKRAGGCLDPEAAFLLARGLKTLALRMRAHCEGATHLAGVLAEHPRVVRVFYPGLEHHPSHAVATRLLAMPGGMVSFEVASGEAALALARGLSLALDAPSLGGVETLVSLPAYMSHVHLSEEERLGVGIRPGLVRVSVGIEDPCDLERDFVQALERAGKDRCGPRA